MRDDQYDAAKQFSMLAMDAAKKSRSGPLLKSVTDSVDQAAEIIAAHNSRITPTTPRTPRLVHTRPSLANVDHDLADGPVKPKLVFVRRTGWR
jgi:hypothetical protein